MCATRTGASQPKSKIPTETKTTIDDRPLSPEELVRLETAISEQERHGIAPPNWEVIADDLEFLLLSVEREGAKMTKESEELLVAQGGGGSHAQITLTTETKTTIDDRPLSTEELVRLEMAI